MSKREAIERLLNPESIAIVGVSQDFTSISGKPMKNLIRHQFKGQIYPINPKYEEIAGFTCYPSLLDIPGEVDVALIAVSSKRMMQILSECEQKNVRSVILFGSGFAEIGEEGERLQEEVLEKAKKAGITILGPNCIGLLNVKKSIPLGFSTSFETKEGFLSGNVGFASQSGALGFSLFGLAQEENIGFSHVINTGNQIDLHTLDCIAYMLEDGDTDVVAGYLEGIPDGEMLIRLAKRAKTLKKPLIVLKAGRSEIGRKAAMSHTASLTGSDETFQAIAKQYGLVTANDVDDMIDLMKVFSRGKQSNGNRVVTISNSGAAGIAMADYSEPLGLELVRLPNETQAKVEEIIPSYGSALNPIDITAQALKEQHIFTDTLEVLINEDEVDVIVIQTTFGGELGQKICKKVAEIDKTTAKPIIVTITGTAEITGEGRTILEKANVPVYTTSYKTMFAIKHLSNFSRFSRGQEPDQFEDGGVQIEENIDATGIWTEVRVKKELDSLGIKIPRGTLIKDRAHLQEVKTNVHYPVVCKGISKDVLHKTDAGSVKANIKDAAELEEAYESIVSSLHVYNPDADVEGILAEEMLQDESVEMFIGVKEDPQFGPLIVCGLGGIFVEVLKDISIRRAPITDKEAFAMLKELKGYPLLEGVRGGTTRDIQALTDALVRISQFASTHQERIQEMDINPLWVFEDGKGIAALDGIIVWKQNEETVAKAKPLI
ncbi:acetate--CoA ligase family protein [Salicibibacter cibarius]|uniref:Acetate--CoA ligase family protein n=1 Tax=Salicibibacter cibarius TaxID=2743000 RepID=A0A7T6Z4V8_9BACI|nr:acetate--CoA ligase family protein [Salicibibacter cibarius]QQK76421.1 acetate--CoA ligase family protein [Salicibibacter cibarius]